MKMNENVIAMLISGIGETLYMTLGSVIIGYIIGLPLGILLYVSGKNGLRRACRSIARLILYAIL